MNIADLVRQLQSEIKEQYGVVVDLSINAHTTENSLSKGKADSFIHKIAEQFDGAPYHRESEKDNLCWATLESQNVTITAFYHMAVEPEDIDEPEQQYEDEGEC